MKIPDEELLAEWEARLLKAEKKSLVEEEDLRDDSIAMAVREVLRGSVKTPEEVLLKRERSEEIRRIIMEQPDYASLLKMFFYDGHDDEKHEGVNPAKRSLELFLGTLKYYGFSPDEILDALDYDDAHHSSLRLGQESFEITKQISGIIKVIEGEAVSPLVLELFRRQLLGYEITPAKLIKNKTIKPLLESMQRQGKPSFTNLIIRARSELGRLHFALIRAGYSDEGEILSAVELLLPLSGEQTETTK